MEMLDVLNKLQEIADRSPEVAKAIESVKQTNPKEVSENAVESEAPTNKEPVKEYEDKIQEYHAGSFKDFLASKGVDIYKLKPDEYSKYAQEYKAEKGMAQQDATTHKGTDDHIATDDMTKEGGMSDVHIGAQEVVGEYVNDDGNLERPKKETLQLMALEKLKAPFPKSYEIETAMQMVNDKFDNNGQAIDEVEPEMFNLSRWDVEHVTAHNLDEAAGFIRDVFLCKQRGAVRDMIVLNVGVSLYLADHAEDVQEGVQKAKEMNVQWSKSQKINNK